MAARLGRDLDAGRLSGLCGLASLSGLFGLSARFGYSRRAPTVLIGSCGGLDCFRRCGGLDCFPGRSCAARRRGIRAAVTCIPVPADGLTLLADVCNDLLNGHVVPGTVQYPEQRAGSPGLHLHHALVRFDVEEHLAFRDGIAFFFHPLHDDAGFHGHAEYGHDDFSGHDGLPGLLCNARSRSEFVALNHLFLFNLQRGLKSVEHTLPGGRRQAFFD